MSTFFLLFSLNAPQATSLMLQVIIETFYHMYILHNKCSHWNTERPHIWKCWDTFSCCRSRYVYTSGIVWSNFTSWCQAMCLYKSIRKPYSWLIFRRASVTDGTIHVTRGRCMLWIQDYKSMYAKSQTYAYAFFFISSSLCMHGSVSEVSSIVEMGAHAQAWFPSQLPIL